MATSNLKEEVYQELSRVTHALSHPKRLELVDLLSQKAFSVDELSHEINMTVASTSQHLQVLKAARLVTTQREGNFIFYRIADDSVARLVLAVRELGFSRNAEINRIITDFRADKNILETITLDDLLAKSKKEKILLLDVRPEDEYQAGHIEGAVSIPVSQLKKRIGELPKGKTIIAYCRGPLCVMSVEAVKILQAKKYPAVQLEDGYMEWKLKQEELSH
ncbi:ArsR/SmtB family transcription factor [Flavihumibacter stibioxidans]|uniref:ArsR family transcriptional regulator n=1 Tax=Flavihumibacter stibioxidans TaxID=1834163 RepID=A0ABR7M413_9BACT|nr:metalloregulator ArsR/SmtB family transcription factor [Flavihumibacter stibioxidans]MBC6489765.1 hypothetical protein [Flavihumibacter stibioxidans]